MYLNRLASTLIIAAGIVLLVLGFTAMDSVGSDISRFFTGSPTDKSVWMVIGGLAALVIGSSGVFIGSSKT